MRTGDPSEEDFGQSVHWRWKMTAEAPRMKCPNNEDDCDCIAVWCRWLLTNHVSEVGCTRPKIRESQCSRLRKVTTGGQNWFRSGVSKT